VYLKDWKRNIEMKVSLQTPIQEQIFLAKKIQMDPRFFGENLLIETNNTIGELMVLGLMRAFQDV